MSSKQVYGMDRLSDLGNGTSVHQRPPVEDGGRSVDLNDEETKSGSQVAALKSTVTICHRLPRPNTSTVWEVRDNVPP